MSNFTSKLTKKNRKYRKYGLATPDLLDTAPEPKIIALVGDAISGGIHAGSSALDRSFLDKYPIDLYIPGNPAHPLTIINGLLDLTRRRKAGKST